MEADFGGRLHMAADFGVNCVSCRYLIGMQGAACKYGGGFRRQFAIWRRIPGPDCNMEADFGGGFPIEVDSGGQFQYGGGFLHEGGGFSLLVKAKPLILCLRSITRGGLNK